MKHKKLKHGCKGCRIQDKKCAWVKKDCALLRRREVTFCFECVEFPCDNLRELDQRHIHADGVSLIDNLLRIREIGAEPWLREQEDTWSCPECGGALYIVDRECCDCGYGFDRAQKAFRSTSGQAVQLTDSPTGHND